MKLIAIETSTDICSIAYIQNGICENIVEEKIPRQHAEKLPLFYDELLNNTDLLLPEIDAVAVSIGPGSFTGLRIGLSYAKGLAFGHKKSIIPVPTMQSILYGSGIVNGKIVTMLLSHGNKYFIQEFGYDQNKMISEQIQVHELDSMDDIVDLVTNKTLIHSGCSKIIKDAGENIQIIEVIPSSKWIGELAHHKYEKWIINEPYKLVPDYVSPFKIG